SDADDLCGGGVRAHDHHVPNVSTRGRVQPFFSLPLYSARDSGITKPDAREPFRSRFSHSAVAAYEDRPDLTEGAAVSPPRWHLPAVTALRAAHAHHARRARAAGASR